MTTLKDLPIRGKRVLIRVDFNVPLDENLDIADDTRIEAALPTIKYVLAQGGIPILMSHLGRPKGEVVPEYSLAPVANRLASMLGSSVIMATGCTGEKVKKEINSLKPGQTILLENLRFNIGEEKPDQDPDFVKKLVSLGDLYINDAFGTSHRAHASVAGIVAYFPGKAAAGLLLEKEIKFLNETLLKPKRPFFALIGGAKVSSKLGVLKSLISKVDALFIGGAMAYTFLKAKGVNIGNSKYEPDLVDTARGIMNSFERSGVSLNLPIDHVIVREVSDKALLSIVDNDEGIPAGFIGVDIGPKTRAIYKQELADGKTIFWNGPLGIFEIPKFAEGTKEIAEGLSVVKAIKIIGGGDSVSAIRSMNLAHLFDHLSTGGGASLEYIEYGKLPAIEALKKAQV